MRAANPQTMNRYAYVLNNPLKYIDPDGLEAKDAWDQLTNAQQKALEGKLELKKGETTRQAFDRLVTVGDDSTATAANIESVQNFVAQAGGLTNSETWQQITAITKVTPGASDLSEPVDNSSRRESSNIEIKVADKNKFFDALKTDPINKFTVNSLGDSFIKGVGTSWHPFDNARAQTDYRTDPQLHYANDKSDDKNYGPNYFFVHWDPTSSNGSKSTLIGDARGGLSHGPMAKIEDVNNYLKRTKQAPQ
jgi:hypothetical protein